MQFNLIDDPQGIKDLELYLKITNLKEDVDYKFIVAYGDDYANSIVFYNESYKDDIMIRNLLSPIIINDYCMWKEFKLDPKKVYILPNEYRYETSCSHFHTFNEDLTLKVQINEHGFKYCPYCGKEIEYNGI